MRITLFVGKDKSDGNYYTNVFCKNVTRTRFNLLIEGATKSAIERIENLKDKGLDVSESGTYGQRSIKFI